MVSSPADRLAIIRNHTEAGFVDGRNTTGAADVKVETHPQQNEKPEALFDWPNDEGVRLTSKASLKTV
jgi:hypothetical protein